jgi:hypothetical protein
MSTRATVCAAAASRSIGQRRTPEGAREEPIQRSRRARQEDQDGGHSHGEGRELCWRDVSVVSCRVVSCRIVCRLTDSVCVNLLLALQLSLNSIFIMKAEMRVASHVAYCAALSLLRLHCS